MAIFRGTTGTGSSDNTIVSAVTEQAGIATTKASEAEGFRDEAEGFKNTASSQANLATTKANEASADASGADSQRQLCVALRLEAYDSAQDALASANAAEASATTANSSAVQTVAGSNTQVVGVYNNIANVNTVAGVNTDVTTVAGISSDITTVAADASDIGTVSTNIANVNNVGNNIANVNAVHSNASNINTVAADGTDIGTVATNIANVNTVAGISSTVTTVAGLESKMDTVIADASDIGAVAGNIGDVTTVAGINSDVDTVAGIAAKVTTVADNISDVQNADTNATNAASSASDASASATSASNSATTATTKATEASNSATAASNSATTATTKASQAAGSATTAGTSASTATTKASEASASATTATTKAGEAASSASAASGSATTATTKAAEADASAVSAASSATKSSNAASTWNNFYNSYLGVADAPPSVDVLGNPIVAGALYYDTGAGSNAVGLYVYNGSSWVYSTNYNNVTAPYTLAQNLNADGNNITAVGSLGIGTSSPSANLHVSSSGDTIARITSADGNSAFLDLGDASDPDGGRIVYDSGSNLALYTASTERMRINSSGRVGIGTTSPANDLHISSATGSARLTSTGGGANVYMESADNNNTRIRWSSNANFAIRNDTTATDVVTINQSGNVGIGTSSPSANLHVDASAPEFRLSQSGTAKVRLRTTGDNYINTGQNLGIGTSSPDAVLHTAKAVNSGDVPNILENAGTSGTCTSSLVFSGNGGGGVEKARIKAAVRGDGFMAFHTNNDTEKMRIDSSGRVGIGTSNPNRVLHVEGTASTFGDTRSVLQIADDTAMAAGVGGGILFTGKAITGQGDSNTAFAGIHGEKEDGTSTNTAGAMLFSTRTSGFSPSERMRIDSSGNVGIGTDSPTGLLTVDGGTGVATTGGTLIVKQKGDTNADGIALTSSDSVSHRIWKDSNGKLNIGSSSYPSSFVQDFSGNIGIGTSSPNQLLSLNSTASTARGISIDQSGAERVKLLYTNSSGSFDINNATAGYTSFSNNGSERMRIDSSGNVLVGTTSVNVYNGTTTGAAITQSGLLLVGKQNDAPAYLNRIASDGNIIQLSRDGTSVGSIGSIAGGIEITAPTYLVLGCDDTGIRIASNEYVLPYNPSTNALKDGAVSLGVASSRFKDLYLSGGVHLGGTGSANKLDDYEEGTFTLNTAGDSSGVFQDTPTCLYTKIGNTVNVFIAFRVGTNFTGQSVGGLPFATSHTGMNSTFINGGSAITSSNNTISATVGNSGTSIRFHDNQNTNDAHLPNTTDEYYRLNFTYKTA